MSNVVVKLANRKSKLTATHSLTSTVLRPPFSAGNKNRQTFTKQRIQKMLLGNSEISLNCHFLSSSTGFDLDVCKPVIRNGSCRENFTFIQQLANNDMNAKNYALQPELDPFLFLPKRNVLNWIDDKIVKRNSKSRYTVKSKVDSKVKSKSHVQSQVQKSSPKDFAYSVQDQDRTHCFSLHSIPVKDRLFIFDGVG